MYKEKIRESLDKLGANYKLLEKKKKISVKIAKFLNFDGKSLLGWFQGKWNLVHVRLAVGLYWLIQEIKICKKRLNLKIKFREL